MTLDCYRLRQPSMGIDDFWEMISSTWWTILIPMPSESQIELSFFVQITTYHTKPNVDPKCYRCRSARTSRNIRRNLYTTFCVSNRVWKQFKKQYDTTWPYPLARRRNVEDKTNYPKQRRKWRNVQDIIKVQYHKQRSNMSSIDNTGVTWEQLETSSKLSACRYYRMTGLLLFKN